MAGKRDGPSSDQQPTLIGAGLITPFAVHRIKIQQMGQGSCIASRVIDTDKFQLRPLPGYAQRQSSHASKTVDTHLNTHNKRSLLILPTEGGA